MLTVAGVWFGYGPSPQYDSDNDGIPDWLEILLGLDPLATNNPSGDVDGDGVPNGVDTEYGNHLIVTVQPVPGERIPEQKFTSYEGLNHASACTSTICVSQYVVPNY
jgi:hypothetical protein